MQELISLVKPLALLYFGFDSYYTKQFIHLNINWPINFHIYLNLYVRLMKVHGVIWTRKILYFYIIFWVI